MSGKRLGYLAASRVIGGVDAHRERHDVCASHRDAKTPQNPRVDLTVVHFDYLAPAGSPRNRNENSR